MDNGRFILSGFIFFNIYEEKISSNKLSLKEFTILRFSRLYPLHLLSFIIVFVIQAFRESINLPTFPLHYSRGILAFLLNIGMLQNGWIITAYSYNAPSWSLSIEIMMYLLFFVIFYRSKKTKNYIWYI
jgi:peptidoglycan/LPS O-acetylase OafA/YrhL